MRVDSIRLLMFRHLSSVSTHKNILTSHLGRHWLVVALDVIVENVQRLPKKVKMTVVMRKKSRLNVSFNRIMEHPIVE